MKARKPRAYLKKYRTGYFGLEYTYRWIAKDYWNNDVLNAISPFVEDGSYIEMSGEEGERWRWIFHKDGIEEKYAQIVWD